MKDRIFKINEINFIDFSWVSISKSHTEFQIKKAGLKLTSLIEEVSTHLPVNGRRKSFYLLMDEQVPVV